ncbi:MAG: ATP-dependent zinc metalloprotease FtsH [Candidatus Eisenbacteria bacterium]|nr:ATP-dependent zinc metalloprotease FtsH [Candidatus Eisenbacteria bacterium]
MPDERKKPNRPNRPAGQGQGPGRDEESRKRREELSRKLLPPQRSRNPFVSWILFVFLALVAYHLFLQNRSTETRISYTQFKEEVQAGNLQSADFIEREIHGVLIDPGTVMREGEQISYREFYTWMPLDDPDILGYIDEHSPNAMLDGQPPPTNWGGVLFSVLPLAVIIIFWIFIMRSMRGGAGPGKAFSFGKSGARLLTEDRPKVTFDDVAGLPEAKQELQEIVEFLREPRRFQRLGGKIPKGALLVGAPGTGKTLLARAVAGEADVPFLSISGSSFVEMFVGVGAARVRDLFEQGKSNAPCIIFIDELDAVGRMRGAGLGGGHDEREQTLNQLLVEMDGFESNDGVILIAATNRPDVLDPALLRPGRFDRQVVVDQPDLQGRKGILEVSAQDVIVGDDVDFEVVARGTPGLSGADLANLVNEAALLAARRDHKAVKAEDFEDAKDKIMLGMERKSVILSEEEIRNTAYHESGHTLVAWLTPGSDPIHKVTIIPRGRALGLTYLLPEDERHNYTKDQLFNNLTRLMGGRAAEEIALKQTTMGAMGDIDTATELARRMVCEWGMSDVLGPVSFGKEERHVFLGREMGRVKDHSEATAVLIDQEIRSLVDAAAARAKELLTENLDKLHLLADALLKRETLTGTEIDELLGVGAPASSGGSPDAGESGGKPSDEEKPPQPDHGAEAAAPESDNKPSPDHEDDTSSASA